MHYKDTYKEISLTSEVLGASPWKQIQLLLDKMKRCIKEACTAIRNKNIEIKVENITRAHDIVIYLRDCLDFEANRELSDKLDGIYRHLGHLLFQANAQNDTLSLEEALQIMDNLLNWWSKVES